MAHIASLAETFGTMVMDEEVEVPKEVVWVPKEEVAVPKEKEKLRTVVMLSGRRQKTCPAELIAIEAASGCNSSQPCGCFFCRDCNVMSLKCTCIFSRTMKVCGAMEVSGATVDHLRATGTLKKLGVKHQKSFKEHAVATPAGIWAPMKNRIWSRCPQYDRKLKPMKLFADKEEEEVETEVD